MALPFEILKMMGLPEMSEAQSFNKKIGADLLSSVQNAAPVKRGPIDKSLEVSKVNKVKRNPVPVNTAPVVTPAPVEEKEAPSGAYEKGVAAARNRILAKGESELFSYSNALPLNIEDLATALGNTDFLMKDAYGSGYPKLYDRLRKGEEMLREKQTALGSDAGFLKDYAGLSKAYAAMTGSKARELTNVPGPDTFEEPMAAKQKVLKEMLENRAATKQKYFGDQFLNKQFQKFGIENPLFKPNANGQRQTSLNRMANTTWVKRMADAKVTHKALTNYKAALNAVMNDPEIYTQGEPSARLKASLAALFTAYRNIDNTGANLTDREVKDILARIPRPFTILEDMSIGDIKNRILSSVSDTTSKNAVNAALDAAEQELFDKSAQAQEVLDAYYPEQEQREATAKIGIEKGSKPTLKTGTAAPTGDPRLDAARERDRKSKALLGE